jgi:hypothetical protein
LPNQERREWVKPIMFSGGVGQIDELHVKKSIPEVGMKVVKVGGPAYRIGQCVIVLFCMNQPFFACLQVWEVEQLLLWLEDKIELI